jgi:hypothetical protein
MSWLLFQVHGIALIGATITSGALLISAFVKYEGWQERKEPALFAAVLPFIFLKRKGQKCFGKRKPKARNSTIVDETHLPLKISSSSLGIVVSRTVFREEFVT